ncbi:hypothetical protein MASR2M8_26100 [Opitutaceae bacterium]
MFKTHEADAVSVPWGGFRRGLLLISAADAALLATGCSATLASPAVQLTPPPMAYAALQVERAPAALAR